MKRALDRVGYSTVGLRNRTLPDALACIAEAGFRQVEIAALAPHMEAAPAERETIEFHKRLTTLGFTGVTVHGPMAKNILGAPDESWRREAVDVFKAYLRFAAGIGASDLVIHPVPNPCFVTDTNARDLPARIEAATRRSLDDLVPVAEREGVRILLENLPYHCNYPLLDMAGLRLLVDPYPEAALGLVVDTGHAWTRKRDPAAEIRIAGSRLRGTHLQDVDGEDPQDNHWLPTQGDLDWTAIHSSLLAVDYPGPWLFEVMNARQGETPEALCAACRAFAVKWAGKGVLTFGQAQETRGPRRVR